MSFELYGTLTSPFVRRVRIVALEKKLPFELVDFNVGDGAARLRALNPLWKMPTVRFADGTVVWDSRVIVDQLTRDGWGPLRAPPTDPRELADEENTVNAIDEALLALIRLFYLKKDNVPADAPFHHKERARVESVFAWLSARIRHGRYVGAFGGSQGFGRAEIALVTALDWIHFRSMAELARWPALVEFASAWAERPSVAETRLPR